MSQEFKAPTLAGFTLLLLLLVIGALYGIYQLHAAHERLEQIVSVNNKKIALATEMQVAGFRRQALIYNMLLVDDPFERDAMFMAMHHETYTVGNSRNQMREMGMGDKGREIFDRQSALIEKVSSAQDKVIALIFADKKRQAWQLMLSEVLKATEQTNETFQQMRELQNQISGQVVEATNRAYHQTLWMTLVLSLFGLLIGASVAYVAYRRTSHHALHLSANLSAMEEQAKSDPLTGLPNRTALLEYLNRRCELVRDMSCEVSHGGAFAVMFFDLDNFKQVNDEFGHGIGDELLKQVAGRVGAILRRDDILARLGGDEFVAVVTLPSDAMDESGRIAEKIRDELARPFALNGVTISIGGSIGIAHCQRDERNPDVLLKRADEAMYCAKRAGRNQYFHAEGVLEEALAPAI